MLFLVVLALFSAPVFCSEEFIVGGSQQDIANWPHQGSLRTATDSHTCGCVLVNANWVLTAAHCVGGAGYSVRFGNTNHNNGQRWTANSITVHGNYGTGAGAYPNDIAIISVSNVGGANIAPIAGGLDNNPGSRPGQDCWITGWGLLSGGGVLPNNLQGVGIPVITDAQCSSRWGNNYNANVHICVFDQAGQATGACNGDSGGPLVCRNNGASPWTLVGLASWVATGCNTAFPCAYTRVNTYLAWVCTNSNGAVC